MGKTLKNRKSASRGITLIALVITIIILLILAGITISALTGENGLWTQSKNAKEQTKKSQVEEDAKLALMTLQIEENQKQMTQEEKRKFLEDEFKEKEPEASVDTRGTGFVANYNGYEVKIDKKYNVTVKEPFNAEEWDKTAAPEDAFIWESDDPNDEGYGVLVGYTSDIQSYTVLRYPSRCTKIYWNDEKYTFQENLEYDPLNRTYIGDRNTTSNIKKVELPETITEIGQNAFNGDLLGGFNFEGLTDIVLPDSVESIGNAAFRYATNLINITIPDSVTSIGSSAFTDCTSLTSITIPDGIKSIEAYTFSDCKSLTNVIIPDSVTSIEHSAFRYCKSFTNIEIPNSVTSIGQWAFSYCTNLTSITIPNSVTSIGYYTFYDCTSLTSVAIPDSVTSIGGNAFGNVPHIYYNGTATGSPWGASAIN